MESNVIPELRFPEFTIEEKVKYYKKYSFRDIFLFSTGKNIKQKEASVKFEIPCVRYGELYHMYNEVIVEVINRTDLERTELIFSEGNEILLPSAGEDPLDIGSASALTIENVAIGRTINILKPKFDLLYSQIFVSYYINQQLKRKISSLAKGVSISNVYNSDLKKLEIVLPSLSEQTKIATFLMAIDKRIQILEKKKIDLGHYKKGVMQKLFTRTIRFKKEDGSNFPDWEENELGKLFNSVKGQGLSKDKIEINGQKECILYGELYTTYSEVINTVKSKTNYNEGVESEVGDLLVPCSTTTTGIDLANVTALNKSQVLLGGDITILRTSEKIDSTFFAYYLSNHKKIELAKYGQGTTIIHLYYNHFKVMNIEKPHFDEQEKIAEFLISIDNSIEKLGAQIKESTVFKQGLLQKMFV